LLKRKVQNTIKSVEFDDSLRIAGDDFISYTLSKSTTPNTYTIKFKNFTTNGIDEFPIKSDEIKKIRVTELNNDSIFTFELKQGLKLSAKLLPSQKVLQINTMVSNDPIITPPVKLPSITPPPVTKIASLANSNFAIPTVQDELSLKFDNSPNDKMDKIYLSSDKRAINYQISTRINPNRIVIDTFGAKISGIANLENINSSFIKKIRSGTNEEGQNDASSRIVLELKKDVLFRETLLSENKVLEIDIGERKKFYVTIDPGHGGRDPGAVGPQKTNEKDVTLAVAYSLRKKLLDDNIGVLLARKDDSEVFLKPRVDLANLSGSDIFVSIHCNAMVSPVSSGIETYYKTSQSSKLAQILHNTIISKLPTLDRGIRTQSFYVIKYTTMPSVLIEIGFITNPNEEALLASAEYQEKVAAAIYDGIKQYMMEKSRI